MAEEVKKEISEKIPIKDLLQLITEEFKNEKDERWKEAISFMFYRYIAFKNVDRFKRFLEEKGWLIEDVENEGEKYMGSLFN